MATRPPVQGARGVAGRLGRLTGRAAAHWERYELPIVIALALLGFLAGYGVMSIGGRGPKRLTELGEFELWLFLIGAQTALWTLGAIAFGDLLRTPSVARVATQARTVVRGTVAAAALPVVGFVLFATLRADVDYPLPHHQAKLLCLSLAGAAIALYGLIALARAHYALLHSSLPGSSEGIDLYLELRGVLQRVLVVEGAIIGAGVLASGALRNTVVAYHKQINPTTAASTFPREHVLLYGAYFTLLLAILYAPVYRRLLDQGRRLVDAVCPAPEPVSPEWSAAYAKRKQLEELLQLQLTTSASFRAGIAIAAPLGSSIVGLLIGAA